MRSRLVEEKQRRLEGEHRGEAHSLELTGGERLGADVRPAARHPPRRAPRAPAARSRREWSPTFSSPKAILARDPAEDDLVLGILEKRRDLAGEVGRAEAAGIEARDHDAALESPAVKVRDEPRERAEKSRLAGAGRAQQRNDLAGLDLERDVRQRGLLRARVRVGEALDPATAIFARRRGKRRTVSASLSTRSMGETAARVRPSIGRRKPRASMASARLSARSSEPATRG